MPLPLALLIRLTQYAYPLTPLRRRKRDDDHDS